LLCPKKAGTVCWADSDFEITHFFAPIGAPELAELTARKNRAHSRSGASPVGNSLAGICDADISAEFKTKMRFQDLGGKSRPTAESIVTGENLFGLDPDEKSDHPKTRALLRRDAKPQPANLTNARFREETVPSRDDQPALLAKAQAGDTGAADLIIRAHLPWVQAAARRRWATLNPPQNSYDENALTLDDFVAAGLAALMRAIKAWTPGANNGFNAQYRLWVRGAIADAARDWRTAGTKCETRIQRLIRSHPDCHPAWIQELYKSAYPESKLPSVEKIEAEQGLAYAMFQPDRYDESSTFTDAGDHDKDGDYLGGESVFNGAVRGYEGGPTGEWSRSQARNSLHPARRIEHPSDWIQPTRKNGGGSIFGERMLAERDTRVIAEINRTGRRAYAQQLVEQVKKHVIDPKSDCYYETTQAPEPNSEYYETREYSPPAPSFDAAIACTIAAAEIPPNDNIQEGLVA
jgi:hypothetical protein